MAASSIYNNSTAQTVLYSKIVRESFYRNLSWCQPLNLLELFWFYPIFIDSNFDSKNKKPS